jgi:hypothetical protein
MRIVSCFIAYICLRSYGLQNLTMLHMSQDAFQYMSQPANVLALDTDSVYRKKSVSRHVYVEEQDKVHLVAPNSFLFTGREKVYLIYLYTFNCNLIDTRWQ